MKACLDCKFFSHIACLQQENEPVNRHLCRKCRHKRHEKLGMKRVEKGQEEKSLARKVEKERKK